MVIIGLRVLNGGRNSGNGAVRSSRRSGGSADVAVPALGGRGG